MLDFQMFTMRNSPAALPGGSPALPWRKAPSSRTVYRETCRNHKMSSKQFILIPYLVCLPVL
jgi:hypothetical protein